MAFLWNLLRAARRLVAAWHAAQPRRARVSSIPQEKEGDCATPLACPRCRPTGPSSCDARRPLRVVRLRESGRLPGRAGRMRISGRMADVCAELDRLAACEDRAASP